MNLKRRLILMLAALTGISAQAATAANVNDDPADETGFPTVTLVSPAQAKTATDCSFSEMMGRNEGFESLAMGVKSNTTDDSGEQASKKPAEADLPDWLKE